MKLSDFLKQQGDTPQGKSTYQALIDKIPALEITASYFPDTKVQFDNKISCVNEVLLGMSSISAFVFNAFCVAVDIGLFKSEVLSTLPNPISFFVVP